MEVSWEPEYPRLTAGECYFPPALMENPAKELPEYFQNVLFRLRRAITGQGEKADPVMRSALTELENNPDLIWLKETHDDNS
jgi:hypothetical protein